MTTTPGTSSTSTSTLRPRDRDAILTSLRAGVVPRLGFQHVQVGRAAEVAALTQDQDRATDGGSFCRFLIGDYGAGKTFLLSLVAATARQKGLVTVHADLTPDRRLQSSTGQARSLYAELMRNLATRAQPEGGALQAVVERFISSVRGAADTERTTAEILEQRLAGLREMTGGYDFAHVIGQYWHAGETDNDQLKTAAARWLRAEYTTKTEARTALGVRTIIDDSSFYDNLKLLARFVRLAGFSGLLVTIDECVNLYKLAHTGARNANYEQILRILNDCLQGSAAGLGVCFAGTPAFLTDTRRGLYSYDALRSRLIGNPYATGGLVDHTGPVLHLANLTQEDLYVLLTKLRHVQAAGSAEDYLVPDDALVAFMQTCRNRVGDAYFRSPRNTVREFLNLLAVLQQNPRTDWATLLGAVQLEEETSPSLDEDDDHDRDTGETPRTGATGGRSLDMRPGLTPVNGPDKSPNVAVDGSVVRVDAVGADELAILRLNPPAR